MSYVWFEICNQLFRPKKTNNNIACFSGPLNRRVKKVHKTIGIFVYYEGSEWGNFLKGRRSRFMEQTWSLGFVFPIGTFYPMKLRTQRPKPVWEARFSQSQSMYNNTTSSIPLNWTTLAALGVDLNYFEKQYLIYWLETGKQARRVITHICSS